MTSVARSFFWWPGQDKEIEELARDCMSCQGINPAPAKAPLHPWVRPTKQWQRIHFDFVGPLAGQFIFVVVDTHSKWPEVFQMPTTIASMTISILQHLFAAYGLP